MSLSALGPAERVAADLLFLGHASFNGRAPGGPGGAVLLFGIGGRPSSQEMKGALLERGEREG